MVYKPELINLALIFSTKEGQISTVDKEDKYSAFTRALYKMATSGLFNVDDDDDGYVEIKELMGPLAKWLRRVSADSRPALDAWGPDDFEVSPVD